MFRFGKHLLTQGNNIGVYLRCDIHLHLGGVDDTLRKHADEYVIKMEEKKFKKLLLSVIILGLALTAAHAIYAIYAYDNSSIIRFISRELW